MKTKTKEPSEVEKMLRAQLAMYTTDMTYAQTAIDRAAREVINAKDSMTRARARKLELLAAMRKLGIKP